MSLAEQFESSEGDKKEIDTPLMWGDPALALKITLELWAPVIQMQKSWLVHMNHFYGRRSDTPLDASLFGSRFEDYFPRSK